jgi:hypothetical protein
MPWVSKSRPWVSKSRPWARTKCPFPATVINRIFSLLLVLPPYYYTEGRQSNTCHNNSSSEPFINLGNCQWPGDLESWIRPYQIHSLMYTFGAQHDERQSKLGLSSLSPSDLNFAFWSELVSHDCDSSTNNLITGYLKAWQLRQRDSNIKGSMIVATTTDQLTGILTISCCPNLQQ